jgi:hypothetical protein
MQSRAAFSCAFALNLLLVGGVWGSSDTVAAPTCADAVFANGLEDAASGTCRAAGTMQVFTDRAAFIAALAPGHIENAFDDVARGASGALNYSDSNVGYQIYTQFFADGALYNGAGFVSTDRVSDSIVVYFLSGNPVTAIGGNFWPSDFSLNPVDGSIDLTLSDGTVETITSGGPDAFRGFIAPAPIFRLTIDAPDIVPAPPGASPDRWPTMDNLVIGTAP